MEKGRITGIGGIFIRSRNPEKLKKWYEDVLGLQQTDDGAVFEFIQAGDGKTKGYLNWSVTSEGGTQNVMNSIINYRVDNMRDFTTRIQTRGVKLLGKIEVFEYGKFVRIKDIEGNLIELWEPVDEVFSYLYQDQTIK